MAAEMRSVRPLLFFLVVTLIAASVAIHCCLADFTPVARAEPESTAAGEVKDERGPIAGARVHVQCDPRTPVLSDRFGRFHLPITTGKPRRITAWKSGYRIAGAPAASVPLTLKLEPLPEGDCEKYSWVAPEPNSNRPQNCGNCHGEIYREWSDGGHARAASNRRFRDLYEGSDRSGKRDVSWNLLREYPDGAGVCAACHAPSVTSDDRADYDLRQVKGTAAVGVHCDLCHKVAAISDAEFGLTHGRFGMTLRRPAHGQLFFGPLDDVDRGDDAYSPIYKESRYCASCHEGTVFGVRVYSTYSEWLETPARKQGMQCQTCHMAPTGRMSNIAPSNGGVERDPQTLASHRLLPGGHAAMLRQCLKTDIQVLVQENEVRVDAVLRADKIGHRLPTGFVDRNLVLAVEAIDSGRKPLPVAVDTPLLPRLSGLPGVPGRLFAKQLRDFDGNSPVPFWRAQPDFADSRLQAGQADRSAYRFTGRAAVVRVRLLYRRFWPAVAAEKQWPNEENEISIVDQSFTVAAGKRIRWSSP
jgi:hypothetical protein